jgi:hypothetical protein
LEEYHAFLHKKKTRPKRDEPFQQVPFPQENQLGALAGANTILVVQARNEVPQPAPVTKGIAG